MDPRLTVARAAAVASATALLPTVLFCLATRSIVALAVAEAAVLALASAYAVYVGIYREPR